MQRQNEELNAQLELPNRTRDGEEFELLANCFGPEDVGTAMSSGASGVGLLRSSYMMLPGHAMDEQEQYLFYTSCLAAARGRTVTVRTFDFGADRTMADAYQGVQSSKLGLRGIRSSLRNLPQMAVQICALMRAAAKGPLRVMFPMVTNLEDWDEAMRLVAHCRQLLRERGEEFDPDTPFGVMFGVPSACLTAEEFVEHGCNFFVIETNDLTQYTHAVDRDISIAERYYRPASHAMKKLIRMVVEAAREGGIPVTICGLAVGNPANTVQYLKENFDEIAEVEFVKRVYLKENCNYAADVFKLRENICITTYDPANNKVTFYRNINPIHINTHLPTGAATRGRR
jgi:phosphotransferase system enzyme I (PtsI)